MFRFLVVNDPHLSDRPPLGRVEGYREHILAKLEELRGIAWDAEVNTIVFTGDLFHSKRPMFTSHNLIQRTLEILNGYPTTLIVPGNHDMGEEGIDSLYRQPLPVLSWLPNVHLLSEMFFTTGTSGVHFAGLPYDHEHDLDPDYYSLKSLGMPRPDGTVVMVAHGSLVPRTDLERSHEYNHYCLAVEDLDLEGVDLLLSGHIHDDLGIHILPNGTVFANVGSLARTSRKSTNLTRTPKVLQVDVTGPGEFEFTEHPLTSALPAEQVFLAPEREDGVIVTDEIAQFAEHLAGGLSLEEAPIDQLIDGFDDVPDNVKALVRRHLENAGV